MSEVTYKRIVDVEQVDTMVDDATLLINNGDALKQIPAAGAFATVQDIADVEEQITALSEE